ncbi:MAG: LysE family transporter [Atribacterota bacterium]|jgi:threonine/homoserine/homoserine lactone efflux protein|nr:LysE family transporter [Atribacterota bacterium]
MFISFLLKAVLISLSGVMAPGPITAVTVSKGTEQPQAGAFIALGHLMVELPLILLIIVGLGKFLEINWIKMVIGILGGLFLLKMGIGLLKNISNARVGQTTSSYTPLQAGIVLSIANPYFLIWWATIGAMLITGAYQFGLVGLISFILLHWGCDFCWYFFLSSLTFKGGRFFGRRLQQILFAVCGIFLLFFSGKFIYDVIIAAFRA